jgi:hypothetical protein
MERNLLMGGRRNARSVDSAVRGAFCRKLNKWSIFHFTHQMPSYFLIIFLHLTSYSVTNHNGSQEEVYGFY